MSAHTHKEPTEADAHRIVTQKVAAMLKRTLGIAATCPCTLGEACLNKAIVALLKGEATEFQQQMAATTLDMHIVKDGIIRDVIGEDMSDHVAMLAWERLLKANGGEGTRIQIDGLLDRIKKGADDE